MPSKEPLRAHVYHLQEDAQMRRGTEFVEMPCQAVMRTAVAAAAAAAATAAAAAAAAAANFGSTAALQAH